MRGREAGEICPGTDEGRTAPLLRPGIHQPLPDRVRLARRAPCTPAFVLPRDGVETGRIGGYPGESLFR